MHPDVMRELANQRGNEMRAGEGGRGRVRPSADLRLRGRQVP
jgi:hypothetical protein